jgi:transcriptional regulator NrdR family protein
VLDSRPVAIGTRRRRECDACGARFTTYERARSARNVGGREPERTGAAA